MNNYDIISEKVQTLRTMSESKETVELCNIIIKLVETINEKEAGFKHG